MSDARCAYCYGLWTNAGCLNPACSSKVTIHASNGVAPCPSCATLRALLGEARHFADGYFPVDLLARMDAALAAEGEHYVLSGGHGSFMTPTCHKCGRTMDAVCEPCGERACSHVPKHEQVPGAPRGPDTAAEEPSKGGPSPHNLRGDGLPAPTGTSPAEALARAVEEYLYGKRMICSDGIDPNETALKEALSAFRAGGGR